MECALLARKREGEKIQTGAHRTVARTEFHSLGEKCQPRELTYRMRDLCAMASEIYPLVCAARVGKTDAPGTSGSSGHPPEDLAAQIHAVIEQIQRGTEHLPKSQQRKRFLGFGDTHGKCLLDCVSLCFPGLGLAEERCLVGWGAEEPLLEMTSDLDLRGWGGLKGNANAAPCSLTDRLTALTEEINKDKEFLEFIGAVGIGVIKVF